MVIHVATVSEEGNEGRLVMLRKVLSKDDWRFMWSSPVRTEAELTRAWELAGEKIVDSMMADIRAKEEER